MYEKFSFHYETYFLPQQTQLNNKPKYLKSFHLPLAHLSHTCHSTNAPKLHFKSSLKSLSKIPFLVEEFEYFKFLFVHYLHHCESQTFVHQSQAINLNVPSLYWHHLQQNNTSKILIISSLETCLENEENPRIVATMDALTVSTSEERR